MRLGTAMMAATVLIASTAGHVDAAAPPIDCRKARGSVDQEICGSGEFMAMDREVRALYDRGMAAFSAADKQRLAESQGAFLKRRHGCEWAAHNSAHPGVAVEECVRNAMEGRVHALRAAVDRGGY